MGRHPVARWVASVLSAGKDRLCVALALGAWEAVAAAHPVVATWGAPREAATPRGFARGMSLICKENRPPCPIEPYILHTVSTAVNGVLRVIWGNCIGMAMGGNSY